MSTATATHPQPALVNDEQLDALVADPAFKTDPARRRDIATHLRDSAPEVRETLRNLWETEGFDPNEVVFVRACFGQSAASNVVAMPEPAAAVADLPPAA